MNMNRVDGLPFALTFYINTVNINVNSPVFPELNNNGNRVEENPPENQPLNQNSASAGNENSQPNNIFKNVVEFAENTKSSGLTNATEASEQKQSNEEKPKDDPSANSKVNGNVCTQLNDLNLRSKLSSWGDNVIASTSSETALNKTTIFHFEDAPNLDAALKQNESRYKFTTGYDGDKNLFNFVGKRNVIKSNRKSIDLKLQN